MIPSTDPTPYIVFAYFIGIGAIGTYIIYNLYLNKKLYQLLKTLKQK